MTGGVVAAVLTGAFSVNATQLQQPSAIPAPGSSALQNILSQPAMAGVDREDIPALRRFYALRNYEPAWQARGQDVRVAADVLAHADREGLDPRDYQTDALAGLATGSNPEAAADADLLVTETVFRYVKDLRSGRLVARTADRDVGLSAGAYDAAGDLAAALQGGRLAAFLGDQSPPYPAYAGLRAALARYRAIAASGAWLPVAAGDETKPDSGEGQRLAARLASEDPSSAATDPDQAALDAAIRRYQTRNGIEPDGRLGKATVASLNVPVSDRIDQIIANMERWRWLPRSLGGSYVAVNAADATLIAVRNGNVVLQSRIIAGKPKSPTPLFQASITAVTVNPFWNIPGPIARREILPKARRKPGYLASEQIEILNGPGGMRLRQLPGPKNALGFLKIEMPNHFDAYLHDTPTRQLFARDERHLSHGCMRVEKIRELASFVLSADPGEDIDLLETKIAAGQTEHIPLDRPLPVYVLYWTAIADQDGAVGFRPDIYGRDQRLLAALAAQHPTGRVSLNSTIESCSRV